MCKDCVRQFWHEQCLFKDFHLTHNKSFFNVSNFGLISRDELRQLYCGIHSATESAQLHSSRSLQVVKTYVLTFFHFSLAAQKVVAGKRQAALLAATKSLPNSPCHSTDSTPLSGPHHGQVTSPAY